MDIIAAVLAAAVAVYLLVRWYARTTARPTIKHIRGPKRCSWLLGTIYEIGHQENVGDLDFEWMHDYGSVWRALGPLGSDVLMVADAKALQHILHKSGYSYPKTVHAIVDTTLVSGKSILSAQSGEDHSRHRKVMNPAFSAPQLRSFLPLFRRNVAKMSQLWRDELLSGSPEGTVIPVSKWLARTTMDIIGEAGLDCNFGALDDTKSEVMLAYENMFVDSLLHPSKWNTYFRILWPYLPGPLLDCVKYVPTRDNTRYKQTLDVINRVSKELIQEKAALLLDGNKSAKDIMSVVVRANTSEDLKYKLTDDEMISQMSVFILGGHETTSNTMSWLLYELAKHPDFQQKLRDEVLRKRTNLSDHGDTDFSMDDLENMVYLQATIKETLRYHPIVYHIARQAAKDDILPLAESIVDVNGNEITEVPVSAGQEVLLSVCAYNRLPSVWGDDAHEWNPMRFIEGNVNTEVKLGMFGNLMSFSAGVRGCIGWRFSLIELHAIVVELIEHFKFALPSDRPDIIRVPTSVMSPMVKGHMDEGVQMPLHVTAL